MKKYIWSILIILGALGNTHAQKKKLSVEERADSILKTRPITYKGINDIIRPFRKDTAQLRYFCLINNPLLNLIERLI